MSQLRLVLLIVVGVISFASAGGSRDCIYAYVYVTDPPTGAEVCT